MNRPIDHILLVQRNRFKRFGLIILSSILLGLLYPVINKEFENPLAFFNGFTIGFLGGVAIAFHEDYRFYKKIKREHFIIRLLKSVTLYTFYFAIIVALVIALTYGTSNKLGFIQYILGPDFKQFIFHGDYIVIVLYALFFCGLVSFTLIMSGKIESRVMFNMITGKYRKPIEENRIFMAIDLNNSTELAEKLEEEEYYEFLNTFYLDLMPAIISTNGQIYRYVGDQVLISWHVSTPARNIACLRTYFMAKNEVRKNKEKYLARWGLSPSFKAVFHCGKVVAGEIGDLKSQFVFHGEVLNQMRIMEKHCRSKAVSVLLSKPYIEMVNLPAYYKLQQCSVLNITATDPILLFTVHHSTKGKSITN